jgi:predicted ABC-type ATPase
MTFSHVRCKENSLVCRSKWLGKSCLFKEYTEKFGPSIFVNADEITDVLKSKALINLSDWKIVDGENFWREFQKRDDAISLISKANESGATIDLIFRENCIVNSDRESNSYEGAYLASFLRYSLRKAGVPFAAESVFSHPSKLLEMEEAQMLGFRNYLYFVCTDSHEINASRVKNRVAKGGHDVPDSRVVERYGKVLDNLKLAVELSYRAYLFDNSGENMILIAEYSRGQIVESQNLTVFPNWVRDFQA